MTEQDNKPVKTFPVEGDDQDDELPRLATYLVAIHDVPNVRVFEKRHWRDQLA